MTPRTHTAPLLPALAQQLANAPLRRLYQPPRAPAARRVSHPMRPGQQQERILAEVRKRGPLSYSQLAYILSREAKNIRAACLRLISAGLLEFDPDARIKTVRIPVTTRKEH